MHSWMSDRFSNDTAWHAVRAHINAMHTTEASPSKKAVHTFIRYRVMFWKIKTVCRSTCQHSCAIRDELLLSKWNRERICSVKMVGSGNGFVVVSVTEFAFALIK